MRPSMPTAADSGFFKPVTKGLGSVFSPAKADDVTRTTQVNARSRFTVLVPFVKIECTNLLLVVEIDGPNEPRGEAAVHEQRLPRHPRGRFGRQEESGADHVFGLAEPFERRVGLAPFLHL